MRHRSHCYGKRRRWQSTMDHLKWYLPRFAALLCLSGFRPVSGVNIWTSDLVDTPIFTHKTKEILGATSVVPSKNL